MGAWEQHRQKAWWRKMMGEELESVKQGMPKDDAQNETETRFQQDLETSILLGFHLKEISLCDLSGDGT